MTPARILVVDDDPGARQGAALTLQAAGVGTTITVEQADLVLPTVRSRAVELVLLDLRMPGVAGEELLAELGKHAPGTKVVVVTGAGDVDAAVRCMKLGAQDFLQKPVTPERLTNTVRRVLEANTTQTFRKVAEVSPRDDLGDPDAFSEITTHDVRMFSIFGYLEAIAAGSQSVLITGETGTGKELIARALHRLGNRTGPFVAVNTAGVDDHFFSDTLFGHVPGAFTGAQRPRAGMLERAGHGTLLLDEIGDLPEVSQTKLLRVLQEREYFPLGSDRPRPLSCRLVAATQADPSKKLRRDLYFRLKSYQVRLPPLRERPRDLNPLLVRFVEEAARDLGVAPPGVPDRVLSELSLYSFPGNIRELQAMTHHAVAESKDGVLRVESFTDQMERPRSIPIGPNGILTEDKLRELERRNLVRALERCQWRISGSGGAAELLGLHPNTLASRMKRHGIHRERKHGS